MAITSKFQPHTQLVVLGSGGGRSFREDTRQRNDFLYCRRTLLTIPCIWSVVQCDFVPYLQLDPLMLLVDVMLNILAGIVGEHC